MRVIALLLALLGVVLLLAVVLGPPARAHGDASWINDGKYTDANGVHCCSVTDCGVISADDVAAVPGGYSVRGFLVPHGSVHSSKDAQHWACTKPGGYRCLFIPSLF